MFFGQNYCKTPSGDFPTITLSPQDILNIESRVILLIDIRSLLLSKLQVKAALLRLDKIFALCPAPQTYLSNIILGYSPVSHHSNCTGLGPHHHAFHVSVLHTGCSLCLGHSVPIYPSTCLTLLWPPNHLLTKAIQTTIFKITFLMQYTCSF